MRKIGIVKLSLLLFILIPVGTATIMHFSYLTPPYETVKEFLNILIEITGILFGIGGIFATFLLKNAYDLRETFKERYEKIGKSYIRTQLREMRGLISRVITLISFFFYSSILSVIFSFYYILTMDISSGDLGLCFGLVIYSFVILFLTFRHQINEIEALQYIISIDSLIEALKNVTMEK
ncbi:hypothetical protein [Candidatus Borrarchaeum sp.]|uniref:hypothetical protein n=1 Tax=Candidatus Borrarchaeum sp. TaxID=2846742 RepID=UPI00257AB3B1|nr:hypothetical protein [Candidatus Borrarchaeum sp.]